MPVNEVQNLPEFASSLEAEALNSDGQNTELLAVRVPPAVMMVLRKTAEINGRSFPEMVRSLLMFHALPGVLSATTDKILKGDNSDGLLSTHKKAGFEVGAARRLLKAQNEVCAQTRQRLELFEKMSASADAKLEKAEQAAAAAYSDYVTRLLELSAAFEANPEAFALDSFIAKISSEAAKTGTKEENIPEGFP